MTRVSILQEHRSGCEELSGRAGEKESVGKTPGEAFEPNRTMS